MKLFEKLSCILASFSDLQEKSGGGAVIRDLEIKIRDFALRDEDRVKTQESNSLARNIEDQQKRFLGTPSNLARINSRKRSRIAENQQRR